MLVFKPLMASKTDHIEAFVTHLPLLFLILILWLSQRHQGWWLVARNVWKGEVVGRESLQLVFALFSVLGDFQAYNH